MEINTQPLDRATNWSRMHIFKKGQDPSMWSEMAH